MRRPVYLLAVLVLLLTSALVSAQTMTVRVQWDPNAATDGVTGYSLTVDSGTPLAVPLGACSVTLCEQPVTIALGSHTFTLTAINQWGATSTSVTQVIAPPLPPKNVRIVK